MIQPISINSGSLAGSLGHNQTFVKHICRTEIRCTKDEHTDSHFLSPSLDSIPNRPLSQWHTAVAIFTHYCFNEMSVPLCVCVGMSVCACVCVCLRKNDVSDPCGPVYLHPCVGVEGGQRQGCLYPSPFPRLLSHRHSGHRRMKRLWICSPPLYTHQSRKIRQKMSTAWPIQSSVKPNTGVIWPERSGSWSTSAQSTCVHTHTHKHTRIKSTKTRFLGSLFWFNAWSYMYSSWVLHIDPMTSVH